MSETREQNDVTVARDALEYLDNFGADVRAHVLRIAGIRGERVTRRMVRESLHLGCYKALKHRLPESMAESEVSSLRSQLAEAERQIAQLEDELKIEREAMDLIRFGDEFTSAPTPAAPEAESEPRIHEYGNGPVIKQKPFLQPLMDEAAKRVKANYSVTLNSSPGPNSSEIPNSSQEESRTVPPAPVQLPAEPPLNPGLIGSLSQIARIADDVSQSILGLRIPAESKRVLSEQCCEIIRVAMSLSAPATPEPQAAEGRKCESRGGQVFKGGAMVGQFYAQVDGDAESDLRNAREFADYLNGTSPLHVENSRLQGANSRATAQIASMGATVDKLSAENSRLQSAVHELEEMVSAEEGRANRNGGSAHIANGNLRANAEHYKAEKARLGEALGLPKNATMTAMLARCKELMANQKECNCLLCGPSAEETLRAENSRLAAQVEELTAKIASVERRESSTIEVCRLINQIRVACGVPLNAEEEFRPTIRELNRWLVGISEFVTKKSSAAPSSTAAESGDWEKEFDERFVLREVNSEAWRVPTSVSSMKAFIREHVASPKPAAAVEGTGERLTTDVIGGFDLVLPNCLGCGKPLTIENSWMTDGCPCNYPLGINNQNETRWRLLMQLQQRQSLELTRLKAALEKQAASTRRWHQDLEALTREVVELSGLPTDGRPVGAVLAVSHLRKLLKAYEAREAGDMAAWNEFKAIKPAAPTPAVPAEEPTDEQASAYLKEAGIDMAEPNKRLHAMIADAKANQTRGELIQTRDRTGTLIYAVIAGPNREQAEELQRNFSETSALFQRPAVPAESEWEETERNLRPSFLSTAVPAETPRRRDQCPKCGKTAVCTLRLWGVDTFSCGNNHDWTPDDEPRKPERPSVQEIAALVKEHGSFHKAQLATAEAPLWEVTPWAIGTDEDGHCDYMLSVKGRAATQAEAEAAAAAIKDYERIKSELAAAEKGGNALKFIAATQGVTVAYECSGNVRRWVAYISERHHRGHGASPELAILALARAVSFDFVASDLEGRGEG